MKQDNISTIPIFSELTQDERIQILGIATEKKYSQGETIFQEGDHPDFLYVVLEGLVTIEKKPLLEEECLTILTLTKGAFFGEMALFDDGPRSAGARASEACRLLLIEKETFLNLLREAPAIATKILLPLFRRLAPRIRQVNTQLAAFFEAGRLLSAATDAPSVLPDMLRLIVAATQARKGILYLINRTTEQLETLSTEGITDTSRLRAIPIKNPEGPVRDVLQNEEALLVSEPRQTGEVQSRYGFETIPMLLIPLKGKQGLLGMLVLSEKNEQEANRGFSYAELSLASCIATQLSYLLENHQFIQEEENRQRLKKRYYRF
ncbi:MAG: cyclic nucleotide-binding domain-containing protein [Candidatus Omnitrophica bacterium]|nr:cyclic nucleotide-binding domain-containing protein [Candidatus Omnitrophota bacterium]